jgi:hypothetical protein
MSKTIFIIVFWGESRILLRLDPSIATYHIHCKHFPEVERDEDISIINVVAPSQAYVYMQSRLCAKQNKLICVSQNHKRGRLTKRRDLSRSDQVAACSTSCW